jgi:DNA-directed RNA polymerase subunit RPC12/RpoP
MACMGPTKKQILYRQKLRQAELEAYRARVAYDEKLVAQCEHPLLFSESFGYEDTLGNYSSEGTTVYHCACCGKQVAQNKDRARSSSVKGKLVCVHGSCRVNLRDQCMKQIPQTLEDVLDTLSKYKKDYYIL